MGELNNKVLMITGGTGSFGNAVLEKFLGTDLAEIRIFSRDEKKQEDMRIKYQNSNINFIIGDIRDFDSINSAMFGVDYLFHAGALKQVPSCEFYPMQAIKTNIIGAENVLEAVGRNNVKKSIVLSTDKAVYPINTMGMTKAIMEKLTIAKARDARVIKNNNMICVTRYGNVMCSRGSVIPLFIQQIIDGKPITITDPNMTRFMMSLSESVGLVFYAFENANAGDIFIQKSPAATVIVLAKALKELFNSSSEIKIIGARHGEKMHESLASQEEMSKAEDLGDYFKIPADYRGLDYSEYVESKGAIKHATEYSSDSTKILSVNEVKQLLLAQEYVRKILEI
jgi:UDP-N-acetylglucosamine 4,6-dehydratase/5-epimerase